MKVHEEYHCVILNTVSRYSSIQYLFYLPPNQHETLPISGFQIELGVSLDGINWQQAANIVHRPGNPHPYKQQNENRLFVFDFFRNNDRTALI